MYVDYGTGPDTMHVNGVPAGVGGSILVTFLALAPVVCQAQEQTLDVVLARAGEYVTQFRRQFSGIVSEERSEQVARTPTNSLGRYSHERLNLRSDFLLVRPPRSDQYVEFRDVYEANGRLTRDREERLTRLFLDPSPSARAQLQSIVNESARFNIGLIERTLNTPTLALRFLDPALQARFAFAQTDDYKPRLEFDATLPSVEAGVWVVEYDELQPRAMIRGKDNTVLLLRGRFWVEASSGRVLASELNAKDSEVEATISVLYQADANIGHFVPVEMRELYRDLYGSRVECSATYSNFRRFQVLVEEVLPPTDDVPQDRH